MLQTLSKVWYGSNNHNINTGGAALDKSILDKLKERFPKASDIKVTDISGGCGAMFDIYVESSDFKGLSIVKQHRIVNDCLKDQIKDMHGIRIVTSSPKE